MGRATVEKRCGVRIPELTNPAAASDILPGKQAIDQVGALLTGTSTAKELPALNNPALASDILPGKQAVNGYGGTITGTSTAKVLPSLSNPAAASDISSGKQSIDGAGKIIQGTGNVLKAITVKISVQQACLGSVSVFNVGTISKGGSTTATLYSGVSYPIAYSSFNGRPGMRTVSGSCSDPNVGYNSGCIVPYNNCEIEFG